MWKWIRIPKGLALIAFLLPWLTVSCSNQKIIEATGLELAIGNISTASQSLANASHPSANLWLIAAAFMILGGLYFTFTKGREAALDVLVTSILSLGLIFIGTHRYSKAALLARASENGAANSDKMAALAMIQVDWQTGYWLTIGSLIICAAMASVLMANKD